METKTKTIGSRTFSVSEMPAFKALDVFEELLSLIGPGLTALAVAGPEGKADDGVKMLFAGLGAKKLRQLATTLLAEVLVEEDGKTTPMLTGFDVRFAGKLLEVFTVMAFVVEVNYRDFFDIVAAKLQDFLLSKLGKQPEPESISPTT